MTTINLPTASLLCVPVPEDAIDFVFKNAGIIHCYTKNGAGIDITLPSYGKKILGIFSPPDGIDFDSLVVNLTKSELIFILNAELSKVYPHKVNPVYKNKPSYSWLCDCGYTPNQFDEQIKLWSEAEKLVLPSRLLIILNK